MNKEPQDNEGEEDPWEALSPEERKKATRHLYILYAAMIILGILPFVAYYIFRVRG